MPLAAGGMARIFIGRSTGIGAFERHVVLKMILPERAQDQTSVRMFLDEARLAASLNHQNVAQVFEVGEEGGIHYLAMEYVHGQDLRSLLAKAGAHGTRVPLELALTILTNAAAGLGHAHERRGADGQPLGIVHRDVSPSNLMVGYDGAVKLLDFGIAKATARSVETQSGIIKGKFAYMAPEQCRGRGVDARSDVFSLGIILYEATTQHRCFRADSDFDTMHRIVTGDVVRPTRLVPGYPPALEAIVMKALAVDPVLRFQSAMALLEAVESFAVDARLPLSTNALGRFMRELFGEQVEPWLTASTRHATGGLPRESTISSTDGRGPHAASAEPAPPPPATLRMMASPEQVAEAVGATASLTLSKAGPAAEEVVAAGWSATSYPAATPVIASAGTLPPTNARAAPEAAPRTSAPSVIPPPAVAPAVSVAPLMPAVALPPSPVATLIALPSHGSGASAWVPAAHVTPPPPVLAPSVASSSASLMTGTSPATPVAALETTPMPVIGGAGALGSHPLPRVSARVMTPPPATRPGYASAPGTTRMGWESGDAPPVVETLSPPRRGLVLGVAAGTIALGVLAFTLLHGGDSDAPPAAVADQGSAVTAAAGAATTPDPVKPNPEPAATIARPDAATASAPVATGSTNGSGAGAAAGSATKPAPTSPPGEPGKPAPTSPPGEPGKPAEPSKPSTVALTVKSDPAGSQVLLDGKLLGTTPLAIAVARHAGAATLTVRHARFLDTPLKVSLDGDVTRTVTLRKDAPPPPVKVKPRKPDCQPPNAVDPFDHRPLCGK
jgi:serine/threonine-protein kinase